jgi:hypothetical protein
MSEAITKKTPASRAKGRVTDDLAKEYRFDYSKARPNRFAAKAKAGSRTVLLDPDIAAIFTTPESVNAVLRALIATMPKKRSAR